MTIKVIINGASGKMGRTTVDAIQREQDLTLVATANRTDNLQKLIEQHQADVVIDFTLPDCVYDNAQTILNANARPVIGTTGLTLSQIEALKEQCDIKKLGAIIAPNFSIGALLMMQFAASAAKYFPDVEIIEMHHPQKVDAPSGTAKKTAELIRKNKTEKNTIDQSQQSHDRAHLYHDIPIHSVRMTGYFASQKILLGDHGELMSIQHDVLDRFAMMPGVFLCCREVMELDRLVYGMESLI